MQQTQTTTFKEQPPSPQIAFTLRSTGETKYEGVNDQEIVEQLLHNADYNRDQYRKAQLELDKKIRDEVTLTNVMTIGFLGISFITCIVCAYLTVNKPTITRSTGYVDRTVIRGDCPQP
jgi:hypothetical protein